MIAYMRPLIIIVLFIAGAYLIGGTLAAGITCILLAFLFSAVNS